MKITRFILSALFGCCLVLSAVACSDLSGDNSDFNFGDMPSDEPENPYDGQGYDRLPSSVRLATYNTHRCEGWTQNSGTDRANYNNTAKVISLMDPDVIALQELDKNTTWHQTDQLQELADRTGMRPYYCKTIDYRGGDYGIGILCKTAPKNTYAGDLPGEEPRKFFLAEFDDYIFIATHFCHKSDENRQRSFEIITEYITAHYISYTKPIYLAGDFNTSEIPETALESWKIISTSANTFVNTASPSRIDYVLVYTGNSPHYELLGTAVPSYEEINVMTVSDHLPVLVDLKK